MDSLACLYNILLGNIRILMCCCISRFELKSIVYGFCFMKGFNNLSGCLRILDEHFVLKRRLLLTPYTWFLLVHFIYHICILGFNLLKLMHQDSDMLVWKKTFYCQIRSRRFRLHWLFNLRTIHKQHCFNLKGVVNQQKNHKKI